MPPRLLVLVFRVACLLAIAASTALLIEYIYAGDPAFCGVASGCMKVRMSGYGAVFGVPLPALGLAAYSLLFTGALVARSKDHVFWLASFAGAGALMACVLIAIQAFVVKAFCKWCVIVDTSALVAGAAGGGLVAVAKTEAGLAMLDRARKPSLALGWALAALASAAIPWLWAQYPTVPPLPESIAALGEPGKVDIIGFTDFQCPFCRKLHPELAKARQKLGDKCHFVRKMMPLDGHPGAMPAALAYCCVPPDKQDEMAEKLYSAPPEMLTKEFTIGMATSFGKSHEEITKCVESPETKAKIEADQKLFESLGLPALPLTFIGPRVILGFKPDRVATFADLATQSRPALPLEGMFVALAVVFALVSVATWRALGDGATKAAA